MGKRLGQIIVIEDDEDDRHILKEVFDGIDISNELKFFTSSEDAYAYLDTTTDKPFLIFSDINLPRMSGVELKKKINANDHLRKKSIPFIFLTTTSAHDAVLDAYESLAQGFFTKPNSMASLKKMIELILDYWKLARHPDSNLV